MNMMNKIMKIRRDELKKHTPNYVVRLINQQIVVLFDELGQSNYSTIISNMSMKSKCDFEVWKQDRDINFLHNILEREEFKIFGMKIIPDEPRHGRWI